MKQVLSFEQMKHLQKLGLNTNDVNMFLEWNESNKDHKVIVSTGTNTNYNCCYPTYTLQDILGKLPVNLNYFGTRYKMNIEPNFARAWCVSYKIDSYDAFVFKLSGNLLDAAYEMLCWCIENGYVKVEKEE